MHPLFGGGAVLLAALAGQCGNSGSQGTGADLGQGSGVDLAESPPDLASAAPPSITSVAPAQGPNLGGTPITITGTGFRSGATVLVGGTACSQVHVLADTSLTCTTASKAGYCGPAAVVVQNPDAQQASLASGFAYQSKAFGFSAAPGTYIEAGAVTPRRLGRRPPISPSAARSAAPRTRPPDPRCRGQPLVRDEH